MCSSKSQLSVLSLPFDVFGEVFSVIPRTEDVFGGFIDGFVETSQSMKVNLEEKIKIADTHILRAQTGRPVRMAMRMTVPVIAHSDSSARCLTVLYHKANARKTRIN